jgi:hypothetical protein
LTKGVRKSCGWDLGLSVEAVQVSKFEFRVVSPKILFISLMGVNLRDRELANSVEARLYKLIYDTLFMFPCGLLYDRGTNKHNTEWNDR